MKEVMLKSIKLSLVFIILLFPLSAVAKGSNQKWAAWPACGYPGLRKFASDNAWYNCKYDQCIYYEGGISCNNYLKMKKIYKYVRK